MSTATGTVIDKATAFKNSVTGANLNKIVCKASSREMLGPKKKHVDFLIHMTNDSKVSMPVMVDLLADRLRINNWVVAFKALVTSHNLMTLGNERYLQCLATRSNNFNLDLFSDKSDLLAYDMSSYLRRYGKYLNCVSASYRALAMDVCRLPKGEGGAIRRMETTKLLKTAPHIHTMLQNLLDIDLQVSELTNGVINTAFLMLYKDLIKLFHAYNDSMINLLEKYFEMKKAEAKEALEIYRKFLPVGDRVKGFLQVAKDVGIDKDSTLDLKEVTADLLPALEEHLKDLESGKKTSTAQAPFSPFAKDTSTKASASPSLNKSLVESQQKRMDSIKQQNATLPPQITAASSSATTTTTTKSESTTEDDLIGLESSAFTAMAMGQSRSPWKGNSPPPQQPVVPATSANPWAPPGGGYQEVSFFGAQQTQGFGAPFGGANQSSTSNGAPQGGNILQPTVTYNMGNQSLQKPQPRNLGSSLETGLTSAVENLSLGLDKSGFTPQKTQHQWKPPTSTVKTGGPNWQSSMASTNVQPQPTMMPQGMMGYGGMTGGYYGMNQPMMPGYGGTMMQPGMSAGGMGTNWNQPNMIQQQQQQPSQFSTPQDPFGPITASQQPLF
ncbi:phosphatidylinositol-binding clathrin assembly protein LAP-like [Dysidea avara]|uniref:phosphatidylinositol-binding clathrin assembly protein LAP-like n=1 Tax=Dysidea avara TaxID=196820 RepID=UPI00332DA738